MEQYIDIDEETEDAGENQEMLVPIAGGDGGGDGDDKEDDDDDDNDNHDHNHDHDHNHVSFKKVIYFVRHAEATHNVREREAIRQAISKGETTKEGQENARKAVLREDHSLKDAPLSSEGTEQARSSGRKLHSLFGPPPSSSGGGTSFPSRQQHQQNAPFRRPDIVLVSPLRRALMTATAVFWPRDGENEEEFEPPLFLAIEALREKRTGFLCDERLSVAELQAEFPHVDFTDVQSGTTSVPIGEDNVTVRARVADYIDNRLPQVPGQYLAIVSHKGWLRELRHTLKARVESGLLRANYDVNEWDKTLYGNAEVRVAAFRWQDGQLVSLVSRSVDNAILASASMMGDGFEFAIGPPNTGFSIFLADRTTKVHFISLAEGRHTVAIRQAGDAVHAEMALFRNPDRPRSAHPLHDARLTKKGARQAEKLRQLLSERPSGGRPFTAFDLVITSPLTRACETTDIIFGDTPGTYGGMVLPPPRVVVRDECRERFGRYVCDARRTVSELEQEFPSFNFDQMPSDDDWVHHDEERESTLEVQARALRFLNWLSARPERCVCVVTHSEFLRHLFGQFGDTLHETDRGALQKRSRNCELRSVVLCSHGKVERDNNDSSSMTNGGGAGASAPSTIRVPSSSSLSSLATLGQE